MKSSPCPVCGSNPEYSGNDPVDLCPHCMMDFILEEPAGARPGEDLVGSILGDYHLLGILGQGGMGVVYKARRQGTDKLVALKVLAAGSWASPEEINRLHQEARALARLHHPNIVPVCDIARKEDHCFFTMEYIEGKTLAEELAEEKLEVSKTVTLMIRLARAVQYAHDHGIIHRDIKPANILLTRKGDPLLTDFGLALEVTGERGSEPAGGIIGTPAYMSPEQARGECANKGSDIYSLGVTLYEMLTARVPFQGEWAVEVLEKIRERNPTPPRHINPHVDPDLDTIVMRCLEKKTENRYASAAKLARDLEKWLAGEFVQARSTGLVRKIMRWISSNRWSAL